MRRIYPIVLQQDSSTCGRRLAAVVGLLGQEHTDDVNTVNLPHECVDKMMKPRPDSRDRTHGFWYVKNIFAIQYPTSVSWVRSECMHFMVDNNIQT